MSEIELPEKHNGEFFSYQHWVNKAQSRIGGTDAICVDSKNRICRIGEHFMIAEKEKAFPVRYYFGLKGRIREYIR